MKFHSSHLSSRRWIFTIPLLANLIISSSASALLMRDNGPEPIIVQIKESLRLSDELDARLSELEAAHNQNGLSVRKWYASDRLLVMVSFPSNFTEQQALTVIAGLQQLPAVEKVVAASAANLEFKPADLGREYASNQAIPEAARRGLDRDELQNLPMTQAQIDEAAGLPHVPNQLIVRWKSRYVWRATTAGFLRDVANFHAAAGARVIREMRSSPTDLMQVIELPNLVTPFANKLRRYNESPWVDYAQPNFIYSESTVVNDPYYTNPGQPNLEQVSAPAAWNLMNGGTHGTQNLVVAVADTGANLDHPDFSPNLSPGAANFVDPGEPVNDFEFFDPFCGCYTPSHGNNVAAIIGAKGNNLNIPPGNPGYMVGVTHNVSLLILKVLPGGTSEDVFNALLYASASNQGHDPAIAINCSFELPPASQLDKWMSRGVQTAKERGMVVVAAAGNGEGNPLIGLNNDLPNNLISPASIPKDNVIAVGAVKANDTKTNFSNYGKYRVELGAPGGNDPPNNETNGILGLRNNFNNNPPWSRMSGTSQAAPHVTGALQLVKSKYPWEDYAGLRDRVIMGTDDIAALNPDGLTPFRTGGRLNLAKALQKRTLMGNVSARAKVEHGDRIVIGGFVVGPPGPCGLAGACGGAGQPPCCLTVAIRGLGPSLTPFGVPNALPDPKLQLNDYAGFPIWSNDDWGNMPPAQQAQLANAGLTPTDPHEAAIVWTLAPGTYTVFMESQDKEEGIGLFEIYELSGGTNERARLRNLSVRCPVGTGDEAAIAGTNLTNSLGPAGPKRRLLMRALGPSLSAYGLQAVLADPQIELRNSSGAVLDSNDQWRTFDDTPTYTSKGLEDKLIDAGFAPANNAESALWPTLIQGSYTTIMTGVNNGTGIGLIDFLEF
jgi:subtilisin family serine protease